MLVSSEDQEDLVAVLFYNMLRNFIGKPQNCLFLANKENHSGMPMVLHVPAV